MKKRLRTLRITLSAALGIMLTLLIATTVLPHGFSAIAKIQLMPALLSLNIGILAPRRCSAEFTAPPSALWACFKTSAHASASS